ncbi:MULTISPECIES: protein translocase subunit SecD [unclassified Rathayibacter]|uniref:protein translocase subunit SecD n=1 Tax=unclassified Rathayibacter TaxID=2609250 RepID=UPI00188C7262|nr:MULTISPECIES: protein translocase subunit SecD [unclassified Rathayibacter]MBF4462464.1 protein translocase subunit SecD [Rathayibacter sp. VKM Ac-2879]MBF4503493.1 protein translocase subunit SecD [Rathayibacter sp. VKM Ac-2878]
MAASTPVRKARRSLSWLGVLILALIGLNAAAVIWGGGSWTPKLALDLEGGTQIVLQPQLDDGETVSSEQLTQAVSIIRQRIDASGVSEAEITTQGSSNIVVSIPGTPDDETLQRIEASAKLDFRPVLVASQATNSAVGGDATSSPSPTPLDPSLSTVPTSSPTNASDLAYVTPALEAQYSSFDCAYLNSQDPNLAPADQPLITCDTSGTAKYILGPVEITGEDISDASNGLMTTSSGASTGTWAVNLSFDAQGTKAFGDVTSRLVALKGSQNQFAIVLDGRVISAPSTNAAITDGNAQISGSFTQESSKTLADQLKYGALPIGFQVQSSDSISATLGSAQLASGLLAGLIGLILVIVYSIVQYRVLGSITIASLVVAAVVTYLVITLLSWREGLRLSLAGVAGLIVSIGITADSFIVYFERIRDELRDGRGLESAVESGWRRALRTIFASDMVNLLAAVVLFWLAVGSVRGFALTLGITTIIDLIVVSLFTHPMLQLLATRPFFADGHRASGLDPRALGAVYRGRAAFRPQDQVIAGKRTAAAREAARRQTIAERKAAEAAGTRDSTDSNGKDA